MDIIILHTHRQAFKLIYKKIVKRKKNNVSVEINICTPMLAFCVSLTETIA